MIEMIARCGFRCDLCPAYVGNIATPEDQARTAAAWSKYFSVGVAAERIRCNGCRAERGEGFEFPELECPIRVCVAEKGVDDCAACVDYPCERMARRMAAVDSVAQRFAGIVTKQEYERYIAPYDARPTIERLRAQRRAAPPRDPDETEE